MPQHLTLENVSPATRLLEKRRQMYEVQDALDAQKEEFQRREENFRRKEETLRQRDLTLQEQLIKFNKFLQDNESKRNRAEKRFAEEFRQKKAREAEIVELDKRLKKLRDDNDELEREVQRNMRYEEFLERVKDANEEYQEINDLVNRYETLENANSDLRKNQIRFEEETEQLRAEFQQYTKDRTNEILAFNNDIASLQKKLELSEGERIKLQTLADNTIKNATNKTLNLGQILMAVENLYVRCISQRPNMRHTELKQEQSSSNNNNSADSVDDFKKKKQESIQKLSVVSSYLNDFRSIVENPKGRKKQTVVVPKTVAHSNVNPAFLGKPQIVQAGQLPNASMSVRTSHSSTQVSLMSQSTSRVAIV
eukprot:GILK01002151.1.p1 GENE.GILK01002151.1~~GILK01002151.1.p1  ORF type:complete len:392 (+),score=107.62 GILK01002151.1:77-1177(+)